MGALRDLSVSQQIGLLFVALFGVLTLVSVIAFPRSLRDQAPEQQERDERFSSLGSSFIGAPNVTVHKIGTGTTSPLGITRCTLSIHAGTSCTSGNCSARWYRPLLNTCGSPLLLRVPSGKMTSESPCFNASASGSSGS